VNDLTQLAKTLGLKFNDPQLFEQALVHRSYLNEHDYPAGHNERLEFLGDAVVELITTEHLYHKFPDKAEGELTALRSAMVRRTTLGEIGAELELHKYLKLSKGEAKSAANQAAILSNTVEALIGAIFLDLGLPAAKQVLAKYLLPKVDAIIENAAHIDSKSRFQEVVQEQESVTPTYQVVSESGPDHDKTFEVAVLVGDKEVARGFGNSKQSAETAAATAGLKLYNTA